jgi:DNA repair protein RecN (Recombination protein N)
MFLSLTIHEFALIENLRIEFSPGLTVITGETGAGKSILIDALGLALGERADTSMIRDGAAKTIVEAEFDGAALPAVRDAVEALGAEWQPSLILRREVPAKGNSRCFVNDTPVTVAALKQIGDLLIDIHGQHEHQSLLHAEHHLAILDAYGVPKEDRDAMAEAYHRFIALIQELDTLSRQRDRQEERRVVLQHQLRELDTIQPLEDEDQRVELELRVAEQAEKIGAMLRSLLDLLVENEHNVSDQLAQAGRMLQELERIDPSLAQQREEIGSAFINAQDAADALRSYADRILYDPERCEALRHRLAELQGLKRRHRSTLNDVIETWRNLRTEFENLDTIDERVERKRNEVNAARATLGEQAARLSAARRGAADRLGPAIVKELRNLSIRNARFETVMTTERAIPDRDERHVLIDRAPVAVSETGVDEVEFYLSTNTGEDVKPLSRVASGGEVSRIMLALKGIFADTSRIPVMVFDEIDVGVSGSVAHNVATAMRRLARHHQIITITHLPQIAGAGATHLAVEKYVLGKRTQVRVRPLDAAERPREIARLISGSEVTDASLRHAEELLATAGGIERFGNGKG